MLKTVPEATNIFAYDGRDEKGLVAVGQEAGPNVEGGA